MSPDKPCIQCRCQPTHTCTSGCRSSRVLSPASTKQQLPVSPGTAPGCSNCRSSCMSCHCTLVSTQSASIAPAAAAAACVTAGVLAAAVADGCSHPHGLVKQSVTDCAPKALGSEGGLSIAAACSSCALLRPSLMALAVSSTSYSNSSSSSNQQVSAR